MAKGAFRSQEFLLVNRNDPMGLESRVVKSHGKDSKGNALEATISKSSTR